MVLTAHDVRDGRVEIVDRDGKVVEHRPVRARDHGIVEMHMFKGCVATDQVVHDGGATGRHAQAHRPLVPRQPLAAEAALGAMQLLVSGDVGGRGVRAVGVTALEQRFEHLLMAGSSLALEDRALVPVELQPAQRIEDLLDVLGRGALAVGVLDAQQESAARVAGEQPVE